MNIFNRVIYAIFITFAIATVLGPLVIPILHRLKFGQNIREEGPKSHMKKSGTPAMGGIIFLTAILIGIVLLCKFDSTLLMLIFVTYGFGVIGFLDDYTKIVKKRSLGLTPSQKIIGQFIVATVFSFFIVNNMKIGTDIFIPFIRDNIDLKWMYIPVIIFIIIGTVNSVNLTDGLDGLASSVTVVVSVFFGIVAVAFWSGGTEHIISKSIAGTVNYKSIAVFSGAICGALLGFLIYNSHPAKVFMGDTGSLALGGAVAAMAVLLKLPLILLIVGLIYVIESLSVIIQVASFKTTGKRVFKMSPIHHHFELCGWSETRIVVVFSIATAILCMIGILSL